MKYNQVIRINEAMEENAGFTLDSWNFNLLRMTAFPTPTHTYEAKVQDWWHHIVGESPETITQNPKVGLSHADGPVRHGILYIDNQPNRIDIVMKEADAPPTATQSTSSFTEAVQYFDGLVEKWLDLFSGPVLFRLAFGAKLSFPVPNREDGYKMLDNFLHAVEIDPVNSSEFLYRINRPRASKMNPSILINRLNTWAVERNMVVVFPLVPDQPVAQQQQLSSVMCSLELDINNKPEFPLNEANIPPLQIFREFIELGKEIAVQGDIP